MNVVLLTTETGHHLYYTWKLSDRFPVRVIFLETRQVEAPFATQHAFEKQRDAYEREVFLAGCPGPFADFAEIREFASMNDAAAVAALRSLDPDVVLVFGTGRLEEPVIQAARQACLNLHGGNPEHYRGLDSHLWTIYHADFDNLVTTLHHVDMGLDTGDIVFQTRLPIQRGMGLHELRAVNTQACVDLSLLALQCLEAGRALPGRPQLQRGRYYSFMPAVLKEECVRRWEQHVATL